MSEWDDRIQNDPVWEELQTLGPVLDDAVALNDIDARTVASIERIRTVLAFIGKRLAEADPAVVLPAPLRLIADAISSVRTNVSSFLNDKDEIHLQQANAQADSAIAALSQVSAPIGPSEFEGLMSALKSYRKAMDDGLGSAKRSISDAQSQAETLRSRVAEFESHIQTTQQRQVDFASAQEQITQNKLAEVTSAAQAELVHLQQVLSDHQRQFSETQEKRAKDFAETVRSAQQQLTQITSDQQGQFSAAQDVRGRDFTGSQITRQAKFDGIIAEYTQRLADQNAEFTVHRESLARGFEDDVKLLKGEYAKRAEDILAGIETQKTHVEKLVGVIGNLGVTSGYQKTANQARLAMWIWQATTVAAIAGLILLAWYTLPLVEDQKGTIHWGLFSGRILLTFACGVLAAYAGSQADKLFAVEGRNRRLALEFEAIGPYLAPLPQDEQDKFRLLIGERSFGRHEPHTGGPEKSPATLIDVLGSKEGVQILQLLAEIVRKEKAAK